MHLLELVNGCTGSTVINDLVGCRGLHIIGRVIEGVCLRCLVDLVDSH